MDPGTSHLAIGSPNCVSPRAQLLRQGPRADLQAAETRTVLPNCEHQANGRRRRVLPTPHMARQRIDGGRDIEPHDQLGGHTAAQVLVAPGWSVLAARGSRCRCSSTVPGPKASPESRASWLGASVEGSACRAMLYSSAATTQRIKMSDLVREPARSRGRATYCCSAVPSHCAAFLGRDHPGQHETVTPAGGLSLPPVNHHGVARRSTRCVEVEPPF